MRTKKVTVYTCQRCAHDTRTRNSKPPLRCGKCKSPYWNRERKARKQ